MWPKPSVLRETAAWSYIKTKCRVASCFRVKQYCRWAERLATESVSSFPITCLFIPAAPSPPSPITLPESYLQAHTYTHRHWAMVKITAPLIFTVPVTNVSHDSTVLNASIWQPRLGLDLCLAEVPLGWHICQFLLVSSKTLPCTGKNKSAGTMYQ